MLLNYITVHLLIMKGLQLKKHTLFWEILQKPDYLLLEKKKR